MRLSMKRMIENKPDAHLDTHSTALAAKTNDPSSANIALLGAMKAALNRFETGLLILDARGYVLHSNSRASEIIENGSLLRLSDGVISASALSDALKLRLAIEHSAAAANLGAHISDLSCDIILHLDNKEGGEDAALLLLMMPLDHTEERNDTAAIILFLHQVTQLCAERFSYFFHRYSLTMAERELALALAKGISLVDAARHIRIKESTARGYLQQIFIKTGTNRQTELVRLMLTHSVPLMTESKRTEFL